jgi:uncharacterized protein (TIRG00374 family)
MKLQAGILPQSARKITVNAGAAIEQTRSDKTSWIFLILRKLFFLIPLGIVGNIVFVLMTTDRSLFRSDFHFAAGYFLIAMILSITPWLTGSLRLLFWSRFLRNELRFHEVFRIVLYAELGAAICPPIIGGSAIKAGMLMQKGFSGGTVLSLTLLESMEDGLFFLFMVLPALTLYSSWEHPVIKGLLSGICHTSHPVVLIVSGVAFCTVLMLAHPRCRMILINHTPTVFMTRIRSAYNNFIMTRQTIIFNGKSVFALTFMLTAIQWICRYSVITLLLISLGLPTKPLLMIALQVIAFALTSLVPTPGGAGGAEAVFYILFKPFLAAESIGLIIIGWRFLTYYFLLFLAAIILLVTNKPKEKVSVVVARRMGGADNVISESDS